MYHWYFLCVIKWRILSLLLSYYWEYVILPSVRQKLNYPLAAPEIFLHVHRFIFYLNEFILCILKILVAHSTLILNLLMLIYVDISFSFFIPVKYWIVIITTYCFYVFLRRVWGFYLVLVKNNVLENIFYISLWTCVMLLAWSAGEVKFWLMGFSLLRQITKKNINFFVRQVSGGDLFMETWQ